MKKVLLCFPLIFFFFSFFLLSPSIYPETEHSPKKLLEQQKDKILDFVRKNKFYFRVEDLILLDYLQRRFSLPHEFSFEKTFTRTPNPKDIKALETYGRLVNYKNITWKKPKQAENFIWLEIKALFVQSPEDCPDKKTLITQLKQQSQEGGYATTHSALALGWFIEQQCLSTKDINTQLLINDISHELHKVALVITFPSDLKVEALAFICYLGKKNTLDRNEIYQLFLFQRNDGAFSGTNHPADGLNVHTTLLMLWLALEFFNEETNYTESMIPEKR